MTDVDLGTSCIHLKRLHQTSTGSGGPNAWEYVQCPTGYFPLTVAFRNIDSSGNPRFTSPAAGWYFDDANRRAYYWNDWGSGNYVEVVVLCASFS